MYSHRCAPPAAALAAALLLCWPTATPAQPDDLGTLDTSLKLAPADAAFYSSSLRLGEQMDRFLKSNAYAKLHALPAAKYAVDQLRKLAAQSDNPLGQINQFFRQPDNRELAELVHDFWKREVFVYGGANWAELVPLLQEVNAAQRFAPLMALLEGGDPGKRSRAQAHAILHTLNESADKIQVPDLVIGFRLSQAAPAVAQIKRLEGLLTQLADQHPPFKGRVKRQQVAGAKALTVALDGSMVPWDKIPWDDLEEEKGEFQKLRARLPKLTLTACLLVQGDYLLLAVGPSTATVEKFGRGPALASRPELKPLAKFADRPLIDIGYASQALAAAAATTGEDIEGLVEMAKAGLEKAPLTEQRRKLIEKDLQQLAKEITAALPKPGAGLSFTFLTERGQEGYSYNYAPAGPAAAGPLTVLDHLGGSPLVAAAGHTGDPTPGYREFVKWVKVFYGHAEAIIKESAPEGWQQKFQAFMEPLLPFFKRLDTITGTVLLPALGAGQSGFVLDAKWTSKNWFPGLDQGDKALPMLEVGCVRSVKDSAQVLRALTSYRELLNDVLARAREYGAPVSGEGVPKAEAKKVSAGTLYYWPLPPAGQDEQIQPNLGLSEQFQVVSLSLKHSERLLASNPLKDDVRRLAGGQAPASVAVVDFAGLIGAIRPWVEQFAVPAAVAQIPDDAPEGLKRDQIAEQVRTVFDVLQCFRTYVSATYREGDATVTHSETVIRDLR
jgi:hypothetical protein